MTAEIIQFIPRSNTKREENSELVWMTYSNWDGWNFDATTNTWTAVSIGHPWPGEDKAH